MRTRYWLGAAVAVLALNTAQAHEAWITPADSGYQVVYGHHDEAESYAPAKVKSLEAWSAEGKELPVTRYDKDSAVGFSVEGQPAIFGLAFDNGFWSKAPGEKHKNLPKDQNPGAESGSHPVKFHKRIEQWSDVVTAGLGLEAELVPNQAVAPKAGDELTLQLLYKGEPASNWEISLGGSHDVNAHTDAKGYVTVPVNAGENSISVSHTIELSDTTQADVYSITTNLRFQAAEASTSSVDE